MSADAEGNYPIDAADLQPVIDLLRTEAATTPDNDAVRHIAADLAKLPSADLGEFSVTFLNRFSPDDRELGSGADWVSLDAGDEGLAFTIGSHVSHPDTGGDSSSETLFQCWPWGGSEGDLHRWLHALASLDRHSGKITATYEHQDAPTLSREKLTEVYENAASDQRLPSDIRAEASRHHENLMAVERLKGKDSGEDYIARVRSDHYAHKFAIFAVAAYGWQLHGWLVGITLLIGLFIIISVTNIATMATASDDNLLRRLRLNRWGWVIGVAIAVIWSGASLSDV